MRRIGKRNEGAVCLRFNAKYSVTAGHFLLTDQLVAVKLTLINTMHMHVV